MTVVSGTRFQTVRTFCYVMVLFLSLANAVFSSLTLRFILPNTAMFINKISIYSDVVSCLQFIWVILLLAHNNRPDSTSTFARSRTHVYSFISFSLLWMASAILDIGQITYVGLCQPSFGHTFMNWCAFRSTMTAVGTVLWIFTSFLWIYIYRTAKSLDVLWGNISHFKDPSNV
ncbi:hypothetical protein ABKN59_010857 [Abortiporus biennis]